MMGKSGKPRGKNEVMAAVLKAAGELFSERGVASVTIRDIAARAGVNHGLIHRHFGSKENLRRKVQDHLAAEVRREIGEPDDLEGVIRQGLRALGKRDAYLRTMARTLLDGGFEGDIQSEFPFVRRMVGLTAPARDEGRLPAKTDLPALVAGSLALALGLLIFSDYILPGTGLDELSRPEAFERIVRAWQAQWRAP